MSEPNHTLTVQIDGLAADAALGEFIDRLRAASPVLFEGNFVRLPQHEVEGLIRTSFFIGFEAGESNALTKLQS